MNWVRLGIIAFVLLAVAQFFLSLVVSAGMRLSRVSLRAFAEKREDHPKLLVPLSDDRRAFLLPLDFGIQVLQIALTLLVAVVCQGLELDYWVLWTLLTMVLSTCLLRQLLPKLIVQSDPEAVLLRGLRLLAPVYHPLRWLSFPLWFALKRNKEFHERRQVNEEEDEAGDEEIQAYLGVGTEEGIIEQDDSRLIQSALEFKNTLVREIMTPRGEMVMIDEGSTMGQLREALVASKFSRLPVYRNSVDEIVGIVYLRNFLTHSGVSKDDSAILPIISEVRFIPETKKVAELLRELQRNGGNMAIVVNEYGSVTGLVTTEDLVEELVGEIRDEDEPSDLDIERQSDGSFIVRGAAEIEELEERLQADFGDLDVSTVSGLVVKTLGRVPSPGEQFVLDGISVVVLESDQRRIEKLQLRRLRQEEALDANEGRAGQSAAGRAGSD